MNFQESNTKRVIGWWLMWAIIFGLCVSAYLIPSLWLQR